MSTTTEVQLHDLSLIFNTKTRLTALKAMLKKALAGEKCAITGLAGSSAGLLFAGLPEHEQPYLIIADDLDQAGYLYYDLTHVVGDQAVQLFPSAYKRDIRYGQIDAPYRILRTEVLNRWYSDPTLRFVVTYPEALAERVPPRKAMDQATLVLSKGQKISTEVLTDRLYDLRFERTDYVYEPGQYALRGSIVDVFSFSSEQPFRIDFFGDEIDSIRTFDIETQLSLEIQQNISIVGVDNAAAQEGVSLLHYVGDNTVLLCHHPEALVDRVHTIAESTMAQSALIAGEGDNNAMEQVVDEVAFIQRFNQLPRIDFSRSQAPESPKTVLRMNCIMQGVYHKNFDLISNDLQDYLERGYQIYILSDSPKQIERLRAIFDDRGEEIRFTAVASTLHEGFIDPDLKICVLTDHQIFDRFHKYSLRSDKVRSGKLALSLKELSRIEVGDYIVHEDHGIGRFGGLVRTGINGTMQEMIKLVYQNGDVIFASIHALHKLAKYRGKEGVEPTLSKLGSGAWGKIKNRTKSKLKDIARDLIQLYSKRKQEQGYAFSQDGYLQQELEASFIYEDTPDQLKATQAVKADMEQPKPMDRLVCGDVGFGKTEVAIRAAFKAATDGKQVAVLVPTTVLAFQHFRTFSQRLADFPVRVEYLSRARSAKETKAILADLAEGKIDIIIGTHILIGKRVKFHDLGLLIVDEEQKFGVSTKEKLKQLKVNVDTLTMSATPIPRTLQFSLMGARDLSTITTPPANRYPILTTVGTLTDEVVAEAINFELSRNGQVFFVNNRIGDLPALEAMIHRLVPDARVVVGHGQLKPEELEERIIAFTNHDYDVLLATTIIESGIDMPNVNTIIINNAHHYGLSDLHQLRGRVGRSHRKAFCYLLIPPGREVTAVARRRLNAIESFSDLGAGIHIAMQDLDIRGAGNLLGAEQSGFIADLGYETYQKILKEAVLELRTEEFADTFEDEVANADPAETEFTTDCTIDTDLELMFPADYVPQEGERISLYRELDGMATDDEVEGFKQRLTDRFGRIPEVGMELIRIVPLRRLATRLGIEKIALKQGSMYLYFVSDENKAYYQSQAFGRILAFLQGNAQRCRLRDVNARRSMLISNVATVGQALDVLRTIRSLSPL